MMNDELIPLPTFYYHQDGEIALHKAASQGHTELCHVLIEAGSNIDMKCKVTGSPCRNQRARYDVFVSYRAASDVRHAKYLYDRLQARGLSVWLYHVSSTPGIPWVKELSSTLVDCVSFVCLLSREAINHPERPWENFSELKIDSDCDFVFLEHRFALELQALRYLRTIIPLMIGDADDASVTPSPLYTNYYSSGCHPHAADKHVEAVELKLMTCLSLLNLGEPLVRNKTAKATLEDIVAFQSVFVDGKGYEAFENVVEKICSVIEEERHVETKELDSEVKNKVNCIFFGRNV
jgi:hypothetical protein